MERLENIEYQTFMRQGKPFTRKLVRNSTHGASHTRLYSIWKGMRRRCNNPNAPKYEYYGGKGIKVCDEWNHAYGGFEIFRDWALTNGYTDELTIDRIDSSKNYCPENCRWITFSENLRIATSHPRPVEYEYYAFNEEQNTIIVFHKGKEFENYTGVDYRRVFDGCQNPNKKYYGWKFIKIPINLVKEGQETIPHGSTMDDELPSEVRIIWL